MIHCEQQCLLGVTVVHCGIKAKVTLSLPLDVIAQFLRTKMNSQRMDHHGSTVGPVPIRQSSIRWGRHWISTGAAPSPGEQDLALPQLRVRCGHDGHPSLWPTAPQVGYPGDWEIRRMPKVAAAGSHAE